MSATEYCSYAYKPAIHERRINLKPRRTGDPVNPPKPRTPRPCHTVNRVQVYGARMFRPGLLSAACCTTRVQGCAGAECYSICNRVCSHVLCAGDATMLSVIRLCASPGMRMYNWMVLLVGMHLRVRALCLAAAANPPISGGQPTVTGACHKPWPLCIAQCRSLRLMPNRLHAMRERPTRVFLPPGTMALIDSPARLFFHRSTRAATGGTRP
mmetsp:Transcript_72889/g.161961  ORF Transcript_72889/g.161961 Transcript_72889/m.161961 type:complete len:212 (-) Transcript_72889:264-899(-)